MPEILQNTKHKTYPEYKDSGVEWLGEVPKGWEVDKLKYVSNVNKRALGDNTADDFEFTYLDISSVDKGKITIPEEKTIFASAPSRARRVVSKDDVIVATVRTYLRAVAHFRELNDFTVVSTGFSTFSAYKKKVLSRFLYYTLFSDKFIEQVVVRSTGVSYPAIKPNDLASLEVVLPSIKDQQNIATYLDEKTATIDAIIGKKKQLIKHLEEKRASVINHAVTKGLDSSDPLTDSGIDWIGKIPKGWQIRKLFHLFKNIASGTTPDSRFLTDRDSGIPWVNTGDLTDSYMNLPAKRANVEAIKEYPALKVYNKDSLIIAMYGATIGKLGIPQFSFCTNQACCVLEKPIGGVLEKFIFFWLLGNKKFIIEMGKGGGQPNINKDTVKSLKISLPPKKMQEKIVAFLNTEVGGFNKTIEKTQKSIQLLTEYRASLISHVVTGKIKV